MKRLGAVLALGLPLAAPSAGQVGTLRAQHAQVPVEGGGAVDVALGDVDGDGDVDILRLAPVSVLKNDGLAFFEAGRSQGGFGDLDSRLSLADLDGDGDLDLGISGQPATALLGDGTGGFASGTWFPAGAVRQELAFGDLDGDGDVDAFLAGYQDRRVLANDGAGAFALLGVPLATPEYVAVARLADVDGDGDLDAFAGNRDSFGAPDSLYANDGSGHLSDVSGQLVPEAESTFGAGFADLDGDGDLDLTAKYHFGPLRSYRNDGTGAFSIAPGQPSIPDVPGGDLVLGDLDGDGTPDVVVAAESAAGLYPGQSHLFLGDGAGGWIDATAAMPPLPYEETVAVDLGDLDGDGDLDLVQAASFQALRVMLGDGAGALRDVSSSLPPAADASSCVALGDVDGNGFPDALIGTGHGERQRLLRNTGDGTWIDASSKLPDKTDGVVRAFLRDLDGDGDLDGVWISDIARALWNDGTGAFIAKGIDVTSDASDGALADLDGDGDLDLVVGSMGAFSHTLLNLGNETFSTTQQNFSSLDVAAIDVGDLNDDGFVDVWAGLWQGSQRIWVGDGAGGMIFWQEPSAGTITLTTDVALVDVDADGDLDAAVAPTGGSGTLYRNVGAATWTQEPLAVRREFTPVDYDGDGDVDLFNASHSIELLVNDGTGAFAEQSILAADQKQGYADVAFADLDGDGDVDAVGANAQDRALANLTRHLAWRRLPDAGEPLTLDLSGAAASPWFLAWSPAKASLQIAPLGTLRLDPTGLHPLGFGALDGDGEDTFEALLPANPSLVGATVFAQGLVGDPLRFTNLEAVPISGF